MCWYTNENNLAIKAAEQDIPVLKVVLSHKNGEVTPYYYRTGKYEEGATYTVRMNDPVLMPFNNNRTKYETKLWKIDKALHSYSSDCNINVTRMGIEVIYKSNSVYCRDDKCIYPKKVTRIDLVDDHLIHLKTIVAKCHIPKGAIYYENELGEIVSDTLVVDKFVDVK